MSAFDVAHKAAHFPKDRRFRVCLSPRTLIVLIAVALGPVLLSWLQHAFFGLPHIAPSPASAEGTPSGPHGFPFWIRFSHFSNLFFLFMLIRSGLSILMDHPRL